MQLFRTRCFPGITRIASLRQPGGMPLPSGGKVLRFPVRAQFVPRIVRE
jgi:hypothetical protein